MDNKQLLAHISKELSIDSKEASSTAQALIDIMSQAFIDGDGVMIPAFGAFSIEKTDEYVSDDLSTGKKILFPPQINLKFTPSAILNKRLRETTAK